MATRSLVTFRLGEHAIAVDVRHVRRVVRRPEIRPLPGTPDFVAGGARIDGQLEVLLDAEVLLAAETPAEPRTGVARAILVRAAGQPLGLLADSVNDVITVPESEIVPAPPFVGGARPAAVEGAIREQDGETLLLDPDRLLTTDELARLTPAGRAAE